ncbi:MAG: DUF177 domain-containing protein [Anaerolineae bacterium]|nr:DUF177 domain-containing protein [Anaerolineae bacterium]MDK1081748.1 DUF177 domain-containing protein [Anaerolineae bacterium]MDK1118433.1 DUF177 domain-containing protein [Anaerolineae bacterium]
MRNTPHPFRLNLGFIVHQEVGYKHEIPFEIEKYQISDDLEIRNFKGVAIISRTPQGLLVQGTFSGESTLECVRCLKELKHNLSWELTDLFAFNEKSVSESDLVMGEDAQIDLQPLLREYALLEIPINPICKNNCKGLCFECGQDLNAIDCGHKNISEESSFSALKDLLEE